MRGFVPPEHDDDGLVRLVDHFGGALSPVVFDPISELFRVEGVPGVIPFRSSLGHCVVGLGDPICDPRHLPILLERFRAGFRNVSFAATSARVAALASQMGFAIVEFGEELTIDPRREPPHGRRGHGLRRKLNHARRQQVQVHEYCADAGVDAGIEAQLEGAVRAWLAGRHGMQVFVAHIDLFRPRALRRFFHADRGGDVVGVLSLVHLGARQGYLLEHLLEAPTAPAGTAELLVMSALEVLGGEGCAFASFGTSTAAALGEMKGLSPGSQWLGRSFFNWAQRAFRLDSVSQFRRKFGDVRAEPSYLLFSPARVGPLQLLALMRAFNVSLAGAGVRRYAARSPVVEVERLVPAPFPATVPEV